MQEHAGRAHVVRIISVSGPGSKPTKLSSRRGRESSFSRNAGGRHGPTSSSRLVATGESETSAWVRFNRNRSSYKTRIGIGGIFAGSRRDGRKAFGLPDLRRRRPRPAKCRRVVSSSGHGGPVLPVAAGRFRFGFREKHECPGVGFDDFVRAAATKGFFSPGIYLTVNGRTSFSR